MPSRLQNTLIPIPEDNTLDHFACVDPTLTAPPPSSANGGGATSTLTEAAAQGSLEQVQLVLQDNFRAYKRVLSKVAPGHEERQVIAAMMIKILEDCLELAYFPEDLSVEKAEKMINDLREGKEVN